jgi:hypothetical protein
MESWLGDFLVDPWVKVKIAGEPASPNHDPEVFRVRIDIQDHIKITHIFILCGK